MFLCCGVCYFLVRENVANKEKKLRHIFIQKENAAPQGLQSINVQKLPIQNWKLHLRAQILMTIKRSYAFYITFHLTRLAKEMRCLR